MSLFDYLLHLHKRNGHNQHNKLNATRNAKPGKIWIRK